MAKIGIHGTPTKRMKSIGKKGLANVPFYKSRKPVRAPFKFRFFYTPSINMISGKTRAQAIDAVYASLNSANIHITGSARRRFRLNKISLLSVNLEGTSIKSVQKRRILLRKTISKKKAVKGEELEVVKGTVPTQELKQIEITKKEIEKLKNETKDMDWFDSNRFIAEYFTDKVMEKIK